jgi:hypothetical protein
MNYEEQCIEDVKSAHPEGKVECYCDNTHEQNGIVCMYCWHVQRGNLDVEVSA